MGHGTADADVPPRRSAVPVSMPHAKSDVRQSRVNLAIQDSWWANPPCVYMEPGVEVERV